jgi:GT2 family glycosyltransferase
MSDSKNKLGKINPRIGIVIVNLNSFDDTSACLESLKSITYCNIEVIVVDNGSIDDSCEQIESQFPYVKLIRLGSNLGSTGGRNTGIAYALKNQCDHVLLLDDDAIVTAGFLEPLIERMESESRIAAVSGKIFYFPENRSGQSDILWFAGCVRRWHTWYNHVGMDEKDNGLYDRAQTVVAMPACLMLLNGRALNEIGLLSEDYFVYWEEADWCARAYATGYTCYYEPKSIIYHSFKSGGRGKETPFYNYLQFRNALIYNSKHNSVLKRIQFWLSLPILLGYRMAVDIRANNVISARAVLWGVWDFFRGRRGSEWLRKRGLIRS